jgi:hypothetical protein
MLYCYNIEVLPFTSTSFQRFKNYPPFHSTLHLTCPNACLHTPLYSLYISLLSLSWSTLSILSSTPGSCHHLDKRLNCPHLGSSIRLPFRLRLAPTPTPLALVQRVIIVTTSCPGIGLGRRSVIIVAGRRQEALGLHHSSGRTDIIVLL